ncbi:MAG: SIS domain-containing protein [Eubacteriales bacterium]|nr:SIS domain-containing protein [Eubacteriales bacterium]
MLDITKLLACAGNNVAETLSKVDPAQIEEIASAIAESKRVFTAGWGRAGNVVRILGMDMSQIGMLVYCVGDNGTPSIHPGDILLINSGSGNTKTIAVIAQQAKEQGAKVALISGAAPEDSIIGKIADINVTVPRLKKNDFRPPVNKNVKNKGLGERVDWGLTAEQREEMAYDDVTGYYESAFALNEVIRKVVMEKIGAKTEDIMYYHNNLE